MVFSFRGCVFVTADGAARVPPAISLVSQLLTCRPNAVYQYMLRVQRCVSLRGPPDGPVPGAAEVHDAAAGRCWARRSGVRSRADFAGWHNSLPQSGPESRVHGPRREAADRTESGR